MGLDRIAGEIGQRLLHQLHCIGSGLNAQHSSQGAKY